MAHRPTHPFLLIALVAALALFFGLFFGLNYPGQYTLIVLPYPYGTHPFVRGGQERLATRTVHRA